MSTKTNRTLAGPPGDCCFNTFAHDGTPVGTKITIADIPTYLSKPRSQAEGSAGSPERIIIFLADVYGAFYQNNMLLQDFLAQNGFTVLGIDYFMGDAVNKHQEPGFDRGKWINTMQKQANELMPKWWAAVKDKYGQEAKYCMAGYCFGAAYTMDFSSDDAVVAASLAHPAFLNENHFRNMKSELVQAVDASTRGLTSLTVNPAPLMLSCAETDHTFPLKERRIAEDILVENKAQYFFQIFSGVEHGFASRSDPSTPDNLWGKEQSARGISMWFHRFLDEKLAKTGDINLKAKA